MTGEIPKAQSCIAYKTSILTRGTHSRWGVAGCCVLCFLFCACVPVLTVCMLHISYLCSGFFSSTPDAYSALCLVLHCAAPLDVSTSLTRIAQQHHHESLFQQTSQCSCSSDESPCHVPERKHNSETASRYVTKHHDQQNQWNKQHQPISASTNQQKDLTYQKWS